MIRIIAGIYKGRKLYAPKGLITRPTSNRLRESLFNICAPYIENLDVLDLFSGSGLLGLEALSRGAKHVTFVENNKLALSCIHQNIKLLNVSEQTNVLPIAFNKAYQLFDSRSQNFDLILADPPYDKFESIELEKTNFFQILKAANKLLKPKGRLFIETGLVPAFSLDFCESYLIEKGRRSFGKSVLWEFERK